MADWSVEEATWAREQCGIALPGGFRFLPSIQIRDDSFHGDRPPCPRGCRGKPHRHGFYLRYAAPRGGERVAVARFLCRPCGLTISVLCAGRLPYRSLPGQRLQAHADRQAGVGQGPDPPPGELEAGCLRRAWTRLRARVEVLKNAFGPLVSSAVRSVEALSECVRPYGEIPDEILTGLRADSAARKPLTDWQRKMRLSVVKS